MDPLNLDLCRDVFNLFNSVDYILQNQHEKDYSAGYCGQTNVPRYRFLLDAVQFYQYPTVVKSEENRLKFMLFVVAGAQIDIQIWR